jgi:hypothetical protein
MPAKAIRRSGEAATLGVRQQSVQASEAAWEVVLGEIIMPLVGYDTAVCLLLCKKDTIVTINVAKIHWLRHIVAVCCAM